MSVLKTLCGMAELLPSLRPRFIYLVATGEDMSIDVVEVLTQPGSSSCRTRKVGSSPLPLLYAGLHHDYNWQAGLDLRPNGTDPASSRRDIDIEVA